MKYISSIVQLSVSAILWCSCLAYFITFGGSFLFLSLLIPPEKMHRIGKWVCRGLLLSAGQWIRQHGRPPPLHHGPYVYVFNHASMLDSFIMISVLPEFTASLGKKEQFSVPLWGWILRRWGTVGIDRSNLKDSLKGLHEVQSSVQSGRSLLIAPEGTRSPDGGLQPFKKGPFHVAINTNSPIVPIAIQGAYEAKRKGSFLLRPSMIDITFGQPISPLEAVEYGVDELRRTTHQRFTQLLSSH